MTRNLYGKKMFVADLIITSFWALFSILHSLWGAWPLTNHFLKESEGLIDTRNDNMMWDREHPDGK